MAKAPKQAFPPDVLSAQCPSRGVLEHVTSLWGVLILIVLAEEMHRFSALRRRVGGVSEKMLAQTLGTLERDGFVQRTAYPEVPPRVEYRLTPLGREVAKKVAALAGWIEENLPRVEEARQARARSERPRRPAARARPRSAGAAGA
jgi:DNA-binding HxlR family transcriptional regulator